MKANFYGEPTMTKQGKTVLSFSTDDRSVLNLYDELHGCDIAIPILALASAGASLIPSPTIATSPNLFLIVSRMFSLSSGIKLE